MKLRRFSRDAGVLVAFCGAFYLLITFVNRLDGESPNVSDFSVAREAADSHAKKQDWNAASQAYQKLTEQDPFNGYAWERYASSFYTMRMAALRELEDLESADEQDAATIGKIRQRITSYSDKSYEAFSKAREFARFRGGSLLRMAVIDASRENYELALGLLQDFVDNGHNTQYGLDKYSQFGRGGESMTSLLAVHPEDCRLHRDPKFWAIVRKETQNRDN